MAGQCKNYCFPLIELIGEMWLKPHIIKTEAGEEQSIFSEVRYKNV